ncbi:hypothetical protein B0H21DRAFT_296689 [Amylocystis lapponica]|nr:hypothetical protein B0H21DRAFT_296689 [Amylocystis lapponica]
MESNLLLFVPPHKSWNRDVLQSVQTIMSIPRSKSAATVHSWTTSSQHSTHVHPSRPELPRSRSAIAPTPWSSGSSNLRRTEKVEDPFSLSDFFPAHVYIQGKEEPDWNWVREPEEDVDEELDDRSGLSLVVEQEHDPKRPSALDAGVGDVIRQEDKLGILSLSAPRFLVSVHLLSPYSEGDLTDDEALYSSMRAHRRTHGLPHTVLSEDRPSSLDGLFCAEDKTEDKYVELGNFDLGSSAAATIWSCVWSTQQTARDSSEGGMHCGRSASSTCGCSMSTPRVVHGTRRCCGTP